MSEKEKAGLPWAGDEHDGKGGSFVFDPVSGKRTLKERTKDAPESKTESTAPAADAPESSPAKRKGA